MWHLLHCTEACGYFAWLAAKNLSVKQIDASTNFPVFAMKTAHPYFYCGKKSAFGWLTIFLRGKKLTKYQPLLHLVEYSWLLLDFIFFLPISWLERIGYWIFFKQNQTCLHRFMVFFFKRMWFKASFYVSSSLLACFPGFFFIFPCNT